jgi:hypothetical protein
MILTNYHRAAMLILLPHCSNGFCSPSSQGATAMRHQAHGFFYALSSMVGGVLGGLTTCRSLTRSANLVYHLPPKVLQLRTVVYNLSQGVSAMRKYAQTTAKSSQYKQSLFSVYHNQNLIAFNVPGVLAFRLKQLKPAAIVKFSRMGGAA